MANISLSISAEKLSALEALANIIGVNKEALIENILDDLLNKGAEDFQEASEYVLKKNAELYRRLS